MHDKNIHSNDIWFEKKSNDLKYKLNLPPNVTLYLMERCFQEQLGV